HQGRTPPCAPALVEAGVSRVVVAVLDPDERVAGRGRSLLVAAGVSVEVGVGAEAATRSLGPYLHHRRTGRPLCLLKTCASGAGPRGPERGGRRGGEEGMDRSRSGGGEGGTGCSRC